MRCRKNHKGCIRKITTGSKKTSKASSKTSEKQDPKPKSATRQIQKMEVIANRGSQPPGRTEAAKTATEEPKEDKLDLSSIMKDVEADFKKSIAKIKMMTEGLEEAEKLQKMNIEFLKKWGEQQFANSGPSSTAYRTSFYNHFLSQLLLNFWL